MTLEIELSPELEAKLKAEAEKQGLSLFTEVLAYDIHFQQAGLVALLRTEN
jgi:hypothetical protein